MEGEGFDLKIWRGKDLILKLPISPNEVDVGQWWYKDLSNKNIVMQPGDSLKIGYGEHAPQCDNWDFWGWGLNHAEQNYSQTFRIRKNYQGEVYEILHHKDALIRAKGYSSN